MRSYLRNLAAAEVAVLNGQFNVAKALRASAHTQRILAMEADCLAAGDFGTVDLLQTILTELQDEADLDVFMAAPDSESSAQAKPEGFTQIRERLQDVIRRYPGKSECESGNSGKRCTSIPVGML